MATSRILKSRHAKVDHFFKWVGAELGRPIETRAVRVTFDAQKGNLKAVLKTSNSNCAQRWMTAASDENINLCQTDRKNIFEKSDFSPEESKSILDTLLRSSWKVCGIDQSLDKSRFLRPVQELNNEKVIVEFGSPNIAKPMHMGHLRSLVTGHFCARICKAAGHDVKQICFLGDWGTQFGILQAGLAKWLPNNSNSVLSSVENLSLDELLRYYVQAVKEKETNEDFFKEALRLSAALESGDTDCLKVWSSIREKTIAHLKSFWSLLGINYDVIQGESEFTLQNHFTDQALKQLKEMGALEVGEDKCINAVLGPDTKFSTPVKIRLVKQDGSSLYLLRDIACAASRKEKFQYDKLIYVVDKSQAHHFIALFRILELLKLQENQYHDDGWQKRLWHVTFGKVEGMSTRSGNFVLLSDVINTGSSIMQENRLKSPNVRNVENENIATQLAISALIVNSLKVRRNRDVKFDWNEALRPTGETGVNLQYTHARLASLENAVSKENKNLMDIAANCDINVDYIMNDPIALALALQIISFEDSFWSSYSELEPCIMLAYLFKLSDKVSKALKHLKVISEEDERIAANRLYLFMLSKRLLSVGLNILGIKPLEEI